MRWTLILCFSVGCIDTTPSNPDYNTPPGTWSYVSLPDTICRDGSVGGVLVNPVEDATGVLFFLGPNRLCTDRGSCMRSAETFTVDDAEILIDEGALGAGIFDREAADNPLASWTHVFVPDCTGDAHLGGTLEGAVEGSSLLHKFNGYNNAQEAIWGASRSLAGTEQIIIAGVNTGSLGALALQRSASLAYPDVSSVGLISDSGPPMDDRTVQPCLQRFWRDTWDIDAGGLVECGASCAGDDWINGLLATRIVDGLGTASILSSTYDENMAKLYGAGNNECDPRVPSPSLSEQEFADGLTVLRDEQLLDTPRWGTYYIAACDGVGEQGEGEVCSQSNWLAGQAFYSLSVDGVSLTDVVGEVLAEGNASDVGAVQP